MRRYAQADRPGIVVSPRQVPTQIAMPNPSVNVHDIVRLALPPGTTLVAGSAGMTHQVTWVATLRTTLPAFAELRGGELAMLSVAAAQELDPRLTLANLVRRLAHAPVSAVAVVGQVIPEDISAAESARLPLLRLPDDCDLREVQREVERLITDYEAQLERRGAQLYNLLTQQSLSGEGMPGLLETLADRTCQSVACYASNGELRAQRAHGSGAIALQAFRPKENTLGENVLLNQQIWVERIGTNSSEHASGYLALAGTKLDEWDRLSAKQGAAALALEFAKEHAVQAAEERLRGDFLSVILTGPPADPGAVVQRGQELGYDLMKPHIALLFSLEERTNGSTLTRVMNNIQNELMRRSVHAPLLRRDRGVLCMLPIAEGVRRSRELAESLRERLINDYPGITLALGTPAPTLVDWTRTLKEAEEASRLGRQLFGSERVLAFSDLGVYRLLVLLRDSPELWTFYHETLSSLVDYDRRQGGELLKTLEAYFNHLGNLRATSESLHVHRNTLLYRLDRIKEISGMDLSDSEEHFSLWLALRAHRVLVTPEPTSQT